MWLARLGAVFLVLELYIFGRWVTSDSFQRVMPGTDDGTNMVWIYLWDGLSIVGSIVFVTWIVRKRIRDGELPPVAIVAMAWMLTAWQDPLVNALRPVYSYNSHFPNFGTWAEFIPGWVDNGGVNPQPIFWWVGIYLFFVPLNMMGVDAYLKWVRRHVPRINRAGLIAFVMVLMFAQDVIGELITLLQGVDRYVWVGGSISLFPGTDYQFPLYEGLVWGCGMVGLSALIYCFRDSRGRMITDRGLDRLKIRRGRTFLRVLSLGAVFNIAMLVFFLGYNVVNQHADTTQPTVPSYIENDMCGLGDNPKCVPFWSTTTPAEPSR
ncbi:MULTISPECIES: spirocyclase AveC family protein [Gordonia]|uniref:spirocyclase AveC family protein n=1 Tax=Gordonia TaxID=2053 RepID=UPI001331A3EC|nr:MULTISPECIES: spirocyclase AveC family protein [Gordonia]MCZ0915270.1 spirocyclase AveC family protein [Gordonia amicalis]UPW12384.1 spirocyclase AveC family protein [Gordonia amicalis]